MDFKTDPMARLLGVALAEQTPAGAVTAAVVERRHLNPYRIAHGGFAYTMGCVTAMAAAAVNLDRETEVSGVFSQYLSALEPGPARCTAELLFDDGENCTYRTQVGPAGGPPCFLQTVTLRPAANTGGARPILPPTIFPAGPDAPPDPVTGLRFPMLAPGPYCDLTQTYLLAREDDVHVLGADVLPQTADANGAAHCGLVYSLCDTGVGSMSGLIGKMAVTVSSAMTYFRPAFQGPVTTRVRCVRDGRTVTYFQTSVYDAAGAPVAAGQFCMHPMARLNALVEQEMNHGI